MREAGHTSLHYNLDTPNMNWRTRESGRVELLDGAGLKWTINHDLIEKMLIPDNPVLLPLAIPVEPSLEPCARCRQPFTVNDLTIEARPIVNHWAIANALDLGYPLRVHLHCPGWSARDNPLAGGRPNCTVCGWRTLWGICHNCQPDRYGQL